LPRWLQPLLTPFHPIETGSMATLQWRQ
jgi:hypothetical protein